MAIDFPSSPTNGQRYLGYVYNGAAWVSAPLGTALPFNLFVGPHLHASQENALLQGSTVNGFYIADQWFFSTSIATGNLTLASVASGNVSPSGMSYCARGYTTTVYPTLGAGEYWVMVHIIEANRASFLRWGTAAAKQMVLRFWSRSNTAGTYSVAIRNSAATRSYVTSFTVAAGEVGLWVERNFVIPGDTSGAHVINGVNPIMSVSWVFGCGTTFQTATANAWQNGNYLAVTTQTNLGVTLNNELVLGDFGLYYDPDATGKPPPWEPVPLRQGASEGARYFNKAWGGRGGMASTTSASRMGAFPLVPMRTGPTYTKTTGGTAMNIYNGIDSQQILSTGFTGYPNPYYNEIDCTSGIAVGAGTGAVIINNNWSLNSR